MQPVIVAIDGPSGSGKSTVSRRVAEKLSGRYVDTGAMYRALTWWFIQQGIDPADRATVAQMCTTPEVRVGTDPVAPAIYVAGEDVAGPIRTDAVTAAVSHVAAVPEVRAHLVALQRHLLHSAQSAGVSIVMEGRDIGSVVAPDANLKIWLTADPQVRAARRALEMSEPAPTATVDGLVYRDQLDAKRAASPAQPAADAVILDATDRTVEEVVEAVLSHLTTI